MLYNSTSIVGTDIRMSKVILELGKNKTVENSILNVAFRMFFIFSVAKATLQSQMSVSLLVCLSVIKTP